VSTGAAEQPRARSRKSRNNVDMGIPDKRRESCRRLLRDLR
jgi:hypothetical protein